MGRHKRKKRRSKENKKSVSYSVGSTSSTRGKTSSTGNRRKVNYSFPVTHRKTRNVTASKYRANRKSY